MWINTGHTLALPTKDWRSVKQSLLAPWMRLHHMDHESMEEILNITLNYKRAGVKFERWGKGLILPIGAYEVGYDSVQIQLETNMKLLEIVTTDERSMVAPNCNVLH